MADAGWALQQAVYTLLQADAPLAVLVGDRIYDEVPQGATFPYVVVGEATVADWDTKGNEGQDHDLMIHVWSRYAGLKEAKQIQGAIHDALHLASLTVSGFSAVLCRVTFSEAFTDQDLKTRHGVQRVNVLTHD